MKQSVNKSIRNAKKQSKGIAKAIVTKAQRKVTKVK